MDNAANVEDIDSFCNDFSKQEEYILKVERFLNKGGSVDEIVCHNDAAGTVLLHSVLAGYERIVQYAVSRGADLGARMKLTSQTEVFEYQGRSWNALELAIILEHHASEDPYLTVHGLVYELLRVECLRRYAPLGLSQLHVDCAVGDWSVIEDRGLILQPGGAAAMDARVAPECPVWGGMSPLLVAAKFLATRVVDRLLDAGASPAARDSGGNTALHYLSSFNYYNDKLFLYNDNDDDDDDDDDDGTFGDFNGMSHLLVACQFCPYTLGAAERMLQAGACPNQQVRAYEYDSGDYEYPRGSSGLHVGAKVARDGRECCPELATLLVGYGAEVDSRNVYGKTALEQCAASRYAEALGQAEYACRLLEAGATLPGDASLRERLVESVKREPQAKATFLRSVHRLRRLDPALVDAELEECAQAVRATAASAPPDFDEDAYDQVCARELSRLGRVGLVRELRDAAPVRHDFKERFGRFVGVDLQAAGLFPAYGDLLSIKLRRRSLEFEKKRGRVREAAPGLVLLLRDVCSLPITCAEEILWNLSAKELDYFKQQLLS